MLNRILLNSATENQNHESALSTKSITKNNNMIEFKKPNIRPTAFEIILKYIYTGEMDLSNHSGEDILGVVVALQTS
ncbi:unnamed protein product [Rhizophagus irregularis]|uniref:BTB domain-containing protein n=1 Tax=Rhizophagus irregularis TaxID=588596 RepID=A0A915Z6P0_9GLOM|nr:unnamed protein product [Rhizophagus irregularis]